MHKEFWWENLLENGHLQRQGRRQEYNIMMVLRGIGCEDLD
jgi:hypothetical protein